MQQSMQQDVTVYVLQHAQRLSHSWQMPAIYLPVAVVRSAVKLEQEQQFLIAKKLQELTGSKNIKLRPMIDTVS
eukprot:359159-Chlamydomonas_euryale.AAC.22